MSGGGLEGRGGAEPEGAVIEDRVDPILASDPGHAAPARALGRSAEGRPVEGFLLGRGKTRISLIAGCHADEPVGPRLLRHLVSYLSSLAVDDPLLSEREWWIVPHVNPDGEARNRAWQKGKRHAYDLASYLAYAVRELPGDDVEFCFPRGPEDLGSTPGDLGSRPENQCLYRWWRASSGPFHLHVSLHGMGFGAGPWFLIEPTWAERAEPLRVFLRKRVEAMGYALHDVERRGEKGFFRLERGFATRPDSRHMRDHFLAKGDPDTAARFRPSSMETIRGLGGDPLTLISELPLFLTPRVGEDPGPPDPEAERWKKRVADWRRVMVAEGSAASVREDAHRAGLRSMPTRDQLALQWALIATGVELVEGRFGSS